MLTEYIQTAMKQARYEILEDGTYFGEIPNLEGLWANAKSLEECRDELKSGLEDWILVGVRFGDEIPVIEGGDISRSLLASVLRKAGISREEWEKL